MTDREILELLLTKVTNLEEKVTSFADRLTKMEQEQQRQGDLIHQLIKNVAATNTRLDSLETRMNRKFEAIETDIHILLDESLNQKRELYRLKNKAGTIV